MANLAANSPLRVCVLQSHRTPLPHEWLTPCVASVKRWAQLRSFDYRWLDDHLFDVLSPSMRSRTAQQPVVASDLARLLWCERLLEEGADVVIWCDADTLIPWPERFRLKLSRSSCAVGREHWVQYSQRHAAREQSKHPVNATPKVFSKVHNAFMWFGQDSTFLPFYRESAEKLLRQHAGPWVSQFIGPKLLTALHNIVNLPVIENAGVASPAIVLEILASAQQPGMALRAWADAASEMPLAINLCASSIRDGDLSDAQMSALCAALPGCSAMPGFDMHDV